MGVLGVGIAAAKIMAISVDQRHGVNVSHHARGSGRFTRDGPYAISRMIAAYLVRLRFREYLPIISTVPH